jgi:hypothetical protein
VQKLRTGEIPSHQVVLSPHQASLYNWVSAVIALSVQMFKYRLPNFLFGTNLVAIWKGISEFCAVIVFLPNLSKLPLLGNKWFF